MDIKLAIFDFDGTLLDTKDAIVIAKQETMRRMGLPVADEQTCANTIGMTSKMGFKTIYPDMADEALDLSVQIYREIFDQTKETVPPTLFPMVRETLEALKGKGVLCTIATSRNRKSLIEFLEKLNINEYFSYISAGEDTKLLKPHGEPVLATLDELSFKATNAIVIGDMPLDIMMGRNAGAYTCGVTYGNSNRTNLMEAGADFIIDNIHELLDLL